MKMPGFTADASLKRSGTSYATCVRSHSGGMTASRIVPAIPACRNCGYILDRCDENGWRPRALCNACAVGNCYSGVENPPPRPPWEWEPRW